MAQNQERKILLQGPVSSVFDGENVYDVIIEFIMSLDKCEHAIYNENVHEENELRNDRLTASGWSLCFCIF